MNKPHRRSRFSAQGLGRFQIEHTGERAAVGKPPSADPSLSPASPEERTDTSADTDLSLPSAVEGPAAFDPPPALRPVDAPPLRTAHRGHFSFWLVPLSFVCLALGALGGHFLPRSPEIKAGAGVPEHFQEEVNPLTAAEQDEVDAAYAARRANKFEEAERRFADLGRKHPDWGTMEVEVGLTLFYQGNPGKGCALLKTAANKGISPAQANCILGVGYTRAQDFSQAESSFAKAVALDPSRTDFYYFWGECLRKEGKPLEAAARFRSAMLRNTFDETTGGLYRAKLWLCEIEADQENADDFKTEFDAALASPLPPMEALFAAAARDLKTGDVRAAAGHLLRARRHTDPKLFRIVSADPIFAQARLQPELAALFQPAPSAAKPGPDKAAGSPAASVPGNEADPAPAVRASASPAKGD